MSHQPLFIPRSDRRVLLALLSLAAALLAALFLLGGNEDQPQATALAADSIAAPSDTVAAAPAQQYYRQPERTVERFSFDPNTADSTALLRLGLQPWQVRNIYKYRAAGGIYRTKEDFARLYGLTVKQYRELEPYIHISADYLPASTLVGERPRFEPDSAYAARPAKIGVGEHVELNGADTTELQTVPGIGSYYARAIEAYGQRLGGYVSTDQLDEIANFPADAKQYFTADPSAVTRININNLTLDQLKRHPYINYYQARAIMDYRRQYGPVQDLNDLHLLRDFPEEAIRRLLPYVEY